MDELIQFNREIDAFARKVPEEATTLQKKIVLEALRRLIEKTAVDTGRARGNWQVTIGSPATGQIEGDWPKTTGAPKTTRPPLRAQDDAHILNQLLALTNLPPYQVVWISNNVDYIEEL